MANNKIVEEGAKEAAEEDDKEKAEAEDRVKGYGQLQHRHE